MLPLNVDHMKQNKINPILHVNDRFVTYLCKPLIIVSKNYITINFVPNSNKAYARRFRDFLLKNDIKLPNDQNCTSSMPNGENIDELLNILHELNYIDNLRNKRSTTDTGNVGVQIYEIIFGEHGAIKGLRPLVKKSERLK
jgi:hypothetical protein